jgi:MerR HTH family regulatory protein
MTAITSDASTGPADCGMIETPVYTVEVLAAISGVASGTILEYHARGLLREVPDIQPRPSFDDDAMRRLRRLESVREAGAMNMAGICLVARLLDEIEDLEDRLRHQR